MPAFNLNEVVRVVIGQSLDNQQVLNVLYYQCTQPDPGLTENSLNSWVGTNIVPAFQGVQSNRLVHSFVLSQKFFPPPPNLPVASTAFVGPGTTVIAALPAQNAIVLTKQTNKAGRKFRGRVYVTGLPQTSIQDGELLAAVFPNWNVLASALKMPVTIGGTNARMVPVLFHKSSGTVDPIVDIQTRIVVRAQRRRQVGKGK